MVGSQLKEIRELANGFYLQPFMGLLGPTAFLINVIKHLGNGINHVMYSSVVILAVSR